MVSSPAAAHSAAETAKIFLTQDKVGWDDDDNSQSQSQSQSQCIVSRKCKQGPAGPPGLAGSPGPTGPPGISGLEVKNGEVVTCAANVPCIATVDCAPKQPIGGGWQTGLIEPFYIFGNGPNGTTWDVRLIHTATGQDKQFYAQAICATVS